MDQDDSISLERAADLEGLAAVDRRGVGLARFGAQGDPAAVDGADDDGVAVRRETGRLDRLGQLFGPDERARHGVPQLHQAIVAGRQELLLVGVDGQRGQLVRVAHHQRRERQLEVAGQDAVARRAHQDLAALALRQRPHAPKLLGDLPTNKQKKANLNAGLAALPSLFCCSSNWAQTGLQLGYNLATTGLQLG